MSNYTFEINVKDITNFWFNFSKWNQSDINEHIEVMHSYADQCEHITEFGVRTGVSTWAWLASKAKVIRCYDINDITNNLVNHFKSTEATRKDFKFFTQNTIQEGFIIEPTDLLFIDTEHTYQQVSKELSIHANKVKKYLIFHDTILCGHEIMRAINEFLENNKNWIIKEHRTNNNGLMILERIS